MTTIERFEGTAMPVNSYVVHGPEAVVVVDGQLTVSDATALRGKLTTIGKSVAALVVTHPHPDHYAAAALVVPDDVPIYATATVDAVIRRDDVEKDEIVGPMMGADWPAVRRFPDQVVADGSTVRLAGLDFAVADLGPGESHADSVWKLGDRWFIGDVVCHDTHAYLADGQHTRWLATLDRLFEEAGDATQLMVGHGEPTDKRAIAGQRAYITAFVDAVADAIELDPDERATQVVQAMAPHVTDERLRFLMELSIEPVAKQMVAEQDSDVRA